MMISKSILSTFVICFVLITGSLSLDKSKDCKCRIKVNERIVGGKISGELDYPWMVSINLRDDRIPLFIRRMMPLEKKLK